MPARGMQGVLAWSRVLCGGSQGWRQRRLRLESCGMGSRNKEQLLPSFSVEGNKPISAPWPGLAELSQVPAALGWAWQPQSRERSSTRTPTTPENWEVAHETPASCY